MPIYEFRCNACRRDVSVFQRSINSTAVTRCSNCGSEDLKRLVSKVNFHRAASGGFDDGGFDEDALLDGVDENDPRAMARWARRMGSELGEDLPPDFDEMVSRMEAGEMPDDDVGDDSFDEDF